jgi:hypothetical protein
VKRSERVRVLSRGQVDGQRELPAESPKKGRFCAGNVVVFVGLRGNLAMESFLGGE